MSDKLTLTPSPIINAITIENYRSIGHLTLDLEPLNVLLGHNAAGKSNVVEAISFLSDVLTGGIEQAAQTRNRESFDDILYRDAATPVIRFELDLIAPSDDPDLLWSLSYFLALGPDPRTGRLQVKEEYLGGEQSGADSSTSVFITLKSGAYQILDQSETPPRHERADFMRDRPALAQLTERRKYPLAQSIYQSLSSIAIFHFDPDTIREEARLVSEPRLGRQGEDLAAVLDNFSRKTMAAILSEMHEMAPRVDDIVLKTGKPGHKLIALLEDGQKKPFYPHQISDGTLRFLALLAVAHGAVAGPLVVIEEAENGIHPTQLYQIVELLRGQASRTQEQQKFILTTHADNLVSRLRPEELRLLARNQVSGETEDITPPISEIEKRLEAFDGSLGDLWFAGGLE